MPSKADIEAIEKMIFGELLKKSKQDSQIEKSNADFENDIVSRAIEVGKALDEFKNQLQKYKELIRHTPARSPMCSYIDALMFDTAMKTQEYLGFDSESSASDYDFRRKVQTEIIRYDETGYFSYN